MKTIIKTTHIDTGGHGYVSVSKKDFALLGISDKISGYSGHTFERIYLEEDQDALTFCERAKELGFEVKMKNSYNLKFNCTHNYVPELFDYKPKVGDIIKVSGAAYTINSIDQKSIRVTDVNGRNYRMPMSNPFKYIDKVFR